MNDTNWDGLASDIHKELAVPHKKLPTGKEAGIEWDGSNGEIRTGPTGEAPSDWSGLIEMWGLDPNEVEIVGDVRRSSWEAQTPSGIQVLNSYRAHIRKRQAFTDD